MANGIVYSDGLILGQKKQYGKNLLDFCVQDPDLEYIMIDATIVRAHACAAGYGEPRSTKASVE